MDDKTAPGTRSPNDIPQSTERRLPAAPQEVTAWHLNWTEHLTEVSVDRDGDSTPDGNVRARREHPFWTQNRDWVYSAVSNGTGSAAFRATRGLEMMYDVRARAVGLSANTIRPIGPTNKNMYGYLAEAYASGAAPC